MIAERQGRARSRPRRLALPAWLPAKRAVALLAAIVIVLGGGWLWFRNSPLVAVHQVRVTGLSGPGVAAISRTLTSEAETMTTLNINVSALKRSVAAYPYVHSLDVSTQFPHGVTIKVLEEVPIATVSVGGRTIVVDGAGDLLPSSSTLHGPLPSVPLGSASTAGNGLFGVSRAGRITASGPLAALRVLAAAPYGFLPHIGRVITNSTHGVVIQLRSGPQVYFGPGGQLADKWTAVLAVLSARGSAAATGAAYIDVSDPQRPAVGTHLSTGSGSTQG